MRVCSVSGCPTIYPANQGSQCHAHRREADRYRGTAAERGYTGKWHKAFRAAVLTRDPVCVLCEIALSTVADHYPISKRDLIAAGLNSNDPERGRGLCESCHNASTAVEQPGGWNAPQG